MSKPTKRQLRSLSNSLINVRIVHNRSQPLDFSFAITAKPSSTPKFLKTIIASPVKIEGVSIEPIRHPAEP